MASRRCYLAGLVGVAALSGCQDVLDRTGESGESDPTDDNDETDEPPEQVHAVETFYAALDEGRFDVANRLLHNESSQSRVTEEQYGHLDAGSVSAESAELIDESGDSAVVRTTVRASSADPPRDIDTTVDIELRMEDGEWKLYSVRPVDTATEGAGGEEEPTLDDEPTPDTGPGPAPNGDPTIVVREFYSAVNRGDAAAANTRVHSEAGDIEVSEQSAEEMTAATLTVESATLIDETPDLAVVDVTTVFSPANGGSEVRNDLRIELVPEDGQWKIYSASAK